MVETNKKRKGRDLTPSIILAAFVSLTLLLVILGFPNNAEGNDQNKNALPVERTGFAQSTKPQSRPSDRRSAPPPREAIVACARLPVQSMCSFTDPRGGQTITGTCAISPRQERICIPNDRNPDRG